MFCAVLYFPVKFIIRVVANKTFVPVLFDKLDAFEFQNVINYKGFFPPLSYQLNAALFTGDYQALVNIAISKIQKKKASVKVKDYYLYLFARVYFELRDFEKLNILVSKHEEYKNLYPSKSFLKTQNSDWSYYRYFLEQKYESCKTICEQRNLELNPKAWNTKIRKLQNDFYYAIACYSNDEFETAKKMFESIIVFAPKMYISEVCKRYLEAIETGLQPEVFEAVIPEKNDEHYNGTVTKRIRLYRIIRIVVLVITVILVATSYVLDYVDQKKQEQQQQEYTVKFEKKLNNALLKNYDQAQFIEYFSIYAESQHIDTFCLIDVGDDRLDLASIVTYDGGETSDLIILVKDIQVPGEYTVKSTVSDYKITFYISDKLLTGSDYEEIVWCSGDDVIYWFGIKRVHQLS